MVLLEMRNDPFLQHLGYPVIQIIEADSAGEWHENNASFKHWCLKWGIKQRWTTTGDHRTAAHIDAAVKQAEVTSKSIQLQSNLPPSHIGFCYDQGVCNRNRQVRLQDVASDGTGVRPISALTSGRYSEHMYIKWLNKTLPVGTTCLVKDYRGGGVRGSNTSKTKARLLVVKRQRHLDGAIVFVDPRHSWKVELASLNFTAVESENLSYFDIIGLLQPAITVRRARRQPLTSDSRLRCFIKLQDYSVTKPITTRAVVRASTHGRDPAKPTI